MANILSVYVESEGMRVIEASKAGSNVTVKNAFEIPLPSGMVDDGMIMDVEEAAKQLRTAFTNNNIKKGKLVFVISSKKIANKEIVIPYIKNQAKIEEIVNANIDEYFPMNNLEDYIFRHTVLDTFENAEGKHYSVLVMAFQKQMVEGYHQIAEILKMPMETVDYYSNAIYQLLLKQLNHGTVLALQMDREVTYVSIMRDKSQLFKRSIPYGRDTIVRNLADYKGISEKEAFEVLSDPQKLDSILTPEEYGELIRDFSASVTRVAEYHTSRNPGTVIELVRLLGTGVDLIGFSEMLGRELGIEVTMVKELAGVKIPKQNMNGINYEQLVDYLPNVGALLKSLNLKVEEEKNGKVDYTFFFILLAIASVSVICVSVFFIYMYKTQTEQKKKLEEEIKELEIHEAAYLDYLSGQQSFQTIQSYYDSTVNDSEALRQLIADLEQVMPKSVGINTFTLVDGEMTMTCASDGKEPIAAFVITLKELPYVSDVMVQNISDTYDEFGQVSSTFNIVFRIHMLTEEEIQTDGGIPVVTAEGGAQ